MLLGVDVGGTFTDAVLVDGDAVVFTAKAPSTPSEPSLAVLEAVRTVLARGGARPADVERFAHGMTVATNALLEGRGARTALIATAGFTDVIELGRQARASLYELCVAAPAPLVAGELRFAAAERMSPERPLRALEPAHARRLVEDVAASRPAAVAVSLLHSYADPSHELLLGALLRELLPHAHVSLSCELVGTFREYERTATTVLDAALSPLIASYLGRLCRDARAIGLCEPQIMQSSGGLTDAARAGAHAALTVLSGPAGGVGGALLLAELAGEPDVLCFDMGGTSCDVCLIERSQVPETAERTIAGRPLALPALDIHTVGAGGGSIAWRDPGGALRVGPASAGADPGPACYGRGGTRPTVTDANLLLGRLLADEPLGGQLTLDRHAAERAVSALALELDLDLIPCAEGIVRVAEAELLGALRVMSVERGVDPRELALMPFGGAGPLHAIALARELGITRVICPRACGVLCALGLAAAAPRRDVSRTVMLDVHTLSPERLQHERRTLLEQARRALALEPSRVRVRHELRYRGQSFELAVDEELTGSVGLDPRELRAAFAHAHELRYGYREESREIELVNMRVSVWGPAPAVFAPANSPPADPTPATPTPVPPAQAASAPPTSTPAPGAPAGETRPIVFDGQPLPAAVRRGDPPPGARLEGPMLCVLAEATLLIAPGWSATADRHGTIHLHDERHLFSASAAPARADLAAPER